MGQKEGKSCRRQATDARHHRVSDLSPFPRSVHGPNPLVGGKGPSQLTRALSSLFPIIIRFQAILPSHRRPPMSAFSLSSGPGGSANLSTTHIG